jgi:hypothetical protein
MKNMLFDRLRLQSVIRIILTQWPTEGYAIIQEALEREIEYEQLQRIQKNSDHQHSDLA